MESTEQKLNDELYYDRAISLALRIAFVGLLLIMAYLILRPFLFPIAWGVIIAVGIHPLFRKLASALGNREKLAAILITLVAILLLVVPSILLTDSTIDSVQNLAVKFEEGSLVIPPVPAGVADWPIIGKPLYDTWYLATINLEAFLTKIAPQLQSLAPRLFSAVAGLVTTVLLSIVSIIIAGVFLVNAKSSEKAVQKMFKMLIGKQGEDFTQLAGATIRSVVQGVLGVAIIQALVSGIGMLFFDIPAAGLWAIIVLFLAVIQLPPILILGPVAAYAFTIMDTTPAVIFLIFSIIVSGSDAFLKPLFLGRGVDVPMLVILLGAIGGMMLGGIIGLFVTGEYLSVPASVGFIALLGIAVQNGMVLVTYFNDLTDRGLKVYEAVQEGALLRLRPVLMTAFTTVLGLMPLLLSRGIGSEVQRPLAAVVVFGLTTSTLITLFFIPALYGLSEEIIEKKGEEP